MAVAGKSGGFYIGVNKVAEIKNWSLDVGADMMDSTNFDSNGWKEFIAGLKEWSASAEGNYKINADANGQKAIQDAWLAGTPLSIELRVGATFPKYTGSALVSSMPIEVAVDGIVGFSVELQGTGALTYAAA